MLVKLNIVCDHETPSFMECTFHAHFQRSPHTTLIGVDQYVSCVLSVTPNFQAVLNRFIFVCKQLYWPRCLVAFCGPYLRHYSAFWVSNGGHAVP